MKRQAGKWSTILVIAVLIVAWMLWFFSPGIHTFLIWTRIDRSGACYVFDLDSGEVAEKSDYQIKGIASPLFKRFSGGIHIDAYQREGESVSCNGSAWHESGDTRIHFIDAFYGGEYTVTRHGRQMTKRDIAYQVYSIWLTGEKNRDILIQIAGENNVIVCADDIQKAEEMLDNWLR